MTGGCCGGEGRPRLLARRVKDAAAAVLPGAGLALLPKCPLCVAAWLTVATGVSVPSASIPWLKGGVMLAWVAVLGAMFWRRVYGRP